MNAIQALPSKQIFHRELQINDSLLRSKLYNQHKAKISMMNDHN